VITQEAVKEVLQSYIDPYLGQDLYATDAIKDIRIDDNNIVIDVVIGYPVASTVNEWQQTIAAKITARIPEAKVTVNFSWHVAARQVQTGIRAITGLKNIIAVASGKGGVGKSTVAVNLALALAAEGAHVGILDADIYGPNQPQMLGVSAKPEVQSGKKLQPVMCYGIQSMSIGYLIDVTTPMVWRGPMVTSALLQLLNDTQWQELDYLFIDLPPGTGDIQLTLAQKIPVTGAVIVTTPQDIALIDAQKGIEMFRKVKIPILGVVENMSLHVCSQCGHQESIFGVGGGMRLAQQYSVPFLGQLPLAKSIREQSDKGCPIVVAEPRSHIAEIYRNIAWKVAAQLLLQAKDYAFRFPKIVIEND
jgi:ATP-binding protein involved in chromosome partitioning